MPLPKPPAQKASLLSAAEFDSQAAPRPEKRSLKPAAAAEVTPQPLELLDSRVAAAVLPPPKTAPTPRAPAAPAVARPRSKPARGTGPAKLFVLDTNVLMHDPMSLFRFDEHDVFLPMITLEELDNHKKGLSEVARNARQVSRNLDALASFTDAQGNIDAKAGIPLNKTGHKDAGGKLFFQTTLLDVDLPAGLPQGKADNQILGVVRALREQQPGRDVVLVSKDINMRVKARALGLPAEDYFNDKTLEDGDLLYTGVLPLPADFWERHGKTMESWQQGGHTFYRISGPLVPVLMINQFVYLETPGATPLYARVTEITGKTAVLKTLRDYAHAKNAVWGVTARNREQNFALNLLMDPECDFVTLAGTAGTGKTLAYLVPAILSGRKVLISTATKALQEQIVSNDLPLIEDGGTTARVIMGSLWGQTAATTQHSPTIYAEIVLPPGGAIPIDAEAEERAVMQVGGEALIDGVELGLYELAVLAPGRTMRLGSSMGGRVMLLGGAAATSPRHAYWNFVHSSRERIRQAMDDWTQGRFPTVPGDADEFIPLPDEPLTRTD